MARCLRCGEQVKKTIVTGMGRYGKCGRCFFRWTEEDEDRPMGYAWKGDAVGFAWLDVPDGCLFVCGGEWEEKKLPSGKW